MKSNRRRNPRTPGQWITCRHRDIEIMRRALGDLPQLDQMAAELDSIADAIEHHTILYRAVHDAVIEVGIMTQREWAAMLSPTETGRTGDGPAL